MWIRSFKIPIIIITAMLSAGTWVFALTAMLAFTACQLDIMHRFPILEIVDKDRAGHVKGRALSALGENVAIGMMVGTVLFGAVLFVLAVKLIIELNNIPDQVHRERARVRYGRTYL